MLGIPGKLPIGLRCTIPARGLTNVDTPRLFPTLLKFTAGRFERLSFPISAFPKFWKNDPPLPLPFEVVGFVGVVGVTVGVGGSTGVVGGTITGGMYFVGAITEPARPPL